MGDDSAGDDRNAEELGARLMERVLGGIARRRDHNGGECRHDFDVCLRDGSMFALEITQDKVEDRERQRGAIQKLEWQFDELSRDWFVDLSDKAWVNDLHIRLSSLLGQLERDDITELTVPRVARDEDESIEASRLQQFRSLGVLACRSYEPEDDSAGSVHIDQSGDPAWGDVNSAVAAAVRHASERPDNAHKLGLATSAAERHLLIWVDQTVLSVSAAMQVGERKNLLPDATPDLPSEIDVVWLALAVAKPIVWRLDRNGWRSLGTPVLSSSLSPHDR